MRLIVVVFWSILLFTSAKIVAQEHRLFTSLEEALSVPADSVFRLDLSRNHLRSIPEEVYRFKNLRYLDLSRNKLDSLSEDFHFDHLEVLDLTKNEFSVFPRSICQNTSLKQLLMGKNHLNTIPDCIGDLVQLRVLDLWFNPIESLPDSLVNLRLLKSLDLRGMSYSPEFQKKWSQLLPWVKIEFDMGCDCAY